MNIKVNSTLMIPIYEQIVDQIKTLIRIGKLEENDMLPSVRSLSKKAYDYLESEGFVVTVHGKGTYVAASNSEIQEEEQRKEVELDIEMAVKKARRYGISDEDIKSIFSLVIDEN